MRKMTTRYVKDNLTIEVLDALPEKTRRRVFVMGDILRRDWKNDYDEFSQCANVDFQAQNIKATIRRHPEAWAIFSGARMTPDDHLRDAAPDLGKALETTVCALSFFYDAISQNRPGWRHIRAAMLSTPGQTALDDAGMALDAARKALAKANGGQL